MSAPNQSSQKKEALRTYFVDEAGDLVLFNKRGKVIIGSEGCSSYFILGAVLIENPHEVRKKIEDLRKELLADSYLAKIPSLERTRLAFHAKDDAPEVRMHVYKLICTLPVKAYAIVRRKLFMIDWVRKQNQRDIDWHYNENKIYDACIKRLFKDRLHMSQENHVTFARRGKSARNQALQEALSKAIVNFERSSGKTVETSIRVISNVPSHEPCLQVADYCLWALQRIYERHEDRFFSHVQTLFRRIIDLDDKRFKDYGVYYDEKNILALDKIKDSLKG